MAAKRPGEGRARIKPPLLGGTLTLPTLRAGPFPLPGRERAINAAVLWRLPRATTDGPRRLRLADGTEFAVDIQHG
ncbi:hypothetical protein D3093_22140 (plasmid) [Azospirillum argentinense]|uniref:Uncharacterized protein n=1 Tax=Azospirillum argentinense TaxID=2970906 RepID=A0A4D8PQ22_9PROT|nr:hypothetical protein D3093_22140 [Azospirillum argentinense]